MNKPRIPRITHKLILKFWRARMNTYEIANRLGMTESEIVKILEEAKENEKNRNKDRSTTIRKSTLESIQDWRGISVPRLRCLEEKDRMGNSSPSQRQKDEGSVQNGNGS